MFPNWGKQLIILPENVYKFHTRKAILVKRFEKKINESASLVSRICKKISGGKEFPAKRKGSCGQKQGRQQLYMSPFWSGSAKKDRKKIVKTFAQRLKKRLFISC